MTFLAPLSAILGAAIFVPLLLALYILRLRRAVLRIPSTLLWQESFEDLQVNAPFQRLRWSLLLLLQLMVFVLLLLALAEPVVSGEAAGAARILVLIDRSASMNTVIEPKRNGEDGPPRTRLDLARDAARAMIRHVGERGGPNQMMIVAFGSSASVVSSFQSDRRLLREAVDRIEPTDEEAALDAALQLADAFAGSTEQPDDQPPEIVLISDGGVAPFNDSTGFALRAGTFRFIQAQGPFGEDPLGSNGDPPAGVQNLGVASFSVRRDFEDPARVRVFARLVNASEVPVETVATLWVDERPAGARRSVVPPAGDDGPGEAPVSFEINLPGGAVLMLRHNHSDQLPADDVAALVIPSPARPRVAIVHPGQSPDPFLSNLLEAAEPQALVPISESGYSHLLNQPDELRKRFDLIVFDRVSGHELPPVPSLTIGGAPGMFETIEPESTGGMLILSWDRQHPVMRYVSLDTLVYADFGAYRLPSDASALAFGSDGPIIAVSRAGDVRHIAVGFELIKSNWPLHVSSTVFMQNAIEYLTLAPDQVGGFGQGGLVYRPGETVTVQVNEDARELRIDGPVRLRMQVEPGSSAVLPPIRQAGLYAVEGAASPHDRVAVSVLSDLESDIRLRPEVLVNAERARARPASSATPQPLWPWLTGAAAALMILEWILYCRRARGAG